MKLTRVLSAFSSWDGDTETWPGQIAWYENADGKGSFGQEQLIFRELDATSVYAADIDGDGDEDVLSASGSSIAWYEQFPRAPGDANLDILFDQLDVVHVLQSAKYLTGETATWGEYIQTPYISTAYHRLRPS